MLSVALFWAQFLCVFIVQDASDNEKRSVPSVFDETACQSPSITYPASGIEYISNGTDDAMDRVRCRRNDHHPCRASVAYGQGDIRCAERCARYRMTVQHQSAVPSRSRRFSGESNHILVNPRDHVLDQSPRSVCGQAFLVAHVEPRGRTVACILQGRPFQLPADLNQVQCFASRSDEASREQALQPYNVAGGRDAPWAGQHTTERSISARSCRR